jgi:tetratricopeptide (TPR) repeat protein
MRRVLILANSLGLALAFSAAAGEPTINEMLSDARKMAVKPGEAPKMVEPDKVVKDDAFIEKMKLRLPGEAGKLDHDMHRRHDHMGRARLWFDIHRYKNALGHALMGVKNERDWHVRHGLAHGQLAQIYMMMGHKELAEKAAVEFRKRTSEPWMLDRHKRLVEWMEKFPKNKEEVEKLREKAASDAKDTRSRKRLLDLYRRDYPRRLDEFTGLLKYRQMYPEDKFVTSGECEWRLMDVMWRFGIYDEGLELAKAFREKYPKHGSTTYGEATYRLGRYYERLGQTAQALECYKEVGAKYPKHHANRRRDDRPSHIQRKIFELTKAMEGRR